MAKNKNTEEPQTLEEALVVIEKLKAEKAESDSVIAELREELKASNKAASNKLKIVEHKGKRYQVTAPKFHYNGSVRSADDLLEDSALVAELLEIEVGFLQLIED
jgi:uncharacterized membrane protein YvbJ